MRGTADTRDFKPEPLVPECRHDGGDAMGHHPHTGARRLIAGSPDQCIEVGMSIPAVLIGIDTPDALAALPGT